MAESFDQPQVPIPPHPVERREPLPTDKPKPAQDDPAAHERILKILNSPSYRQSDQDIEFLNQNETRGVRLQLDYQKAELLLEQHGVKETIVVFGGTRIVEPAAAERRLEVLRTAQIADPENRELARRVQIAERVLAKSHYYDVAREFGRLVGMSQKAAGCNLVVVTGGGPGIMEAANRGSYDVGAQSVGLNIHLRREQYPNPYITPDLCFRFHYFAIRKLHFMLRAKALVAFPGGYGTLDELFETLTLAQTRTMKPVPVVLVGESYWRRVLNFDFLMDEGVIDPEDRELFWYAETAQEIWDGIQRWRTLSAECQQPVKTPLKA